MANSVDLVIGSEAIKQVENLVAKLSLADAELLKISQTAASASKGISGISTPSGLDKTVQSTTALNAQLEKQNTIITKLHADIAKKAEQSRLAEIRLQQQREKAFDSFEKNANKERVIAEKNSSAYNKTQTQINNLTKAYNDLAVRKERYNNLTANEEMRLKTLSSVNEKYNGILKATDATIGKNQRNVGNYASGYNALGNSINQLSREAPAFANSVNTGFMALSNNFPALFDAINGIRDKNKMLVAEGKPTVSVLKSIGAAVFGWQTLLSVGVTLLTLYGGKIIEWAMSISDAEKAQKALNEELLTAKTAITSEITQIQSLTAIVLDHNESSINRKLAYEEIKKTLPGLTSATYDQAVSTGELTKATDLYVLSLIQKNIVEAEAKSIAEEQTKLNKENAISYEEHIGKVEAWLQSLQPERQRKNIEKSLKAQRKAEADNQQAIIDDRKKALTQSQEDYLKTQSALATFITAPEKTKKAKQKKAKREDLDHLESYIVPVKTIVDEINAEINRLTTEKIIANDAELPAINEQLSLLLQLKKQLNETPIGGAILPEHFAERTSEGLVKLKTDWKETFNSIADSAQQAGDIMAEFSQRNFDNEYRRLEAQKDISLKFAGDSAAAKQKIEADYEKKRNEIANRENKAKQKQAIFNIAIDTAQAIMATVGKTGFAGLPLALILGALGAAQIALVASQKIPQYFDGTDNHTGGLMLVNDGAGANFREKVILPNGKEIMPEGRNVLMNAPKGTKVLTHEQQIMQMLNERGISMSRNYQTNGGMTADEMDSVIGKHFAKIQVSQTTYDKKGFSSWIGSNGNRTIQNNNRVSRTGFKV